MLLQLTFVIYTVELNTCTQLS